MCVVYVLKNGLEQFPFPFGNVTIIGERGITLRGGHRARINLTRQI